MTNITMWLNMPFYSLIVSVALIVLWGVWRMTGLRRHTHWKINRVVLVMIPVVALLIGLIPFLMPDKGLTTAAVEINPVASPAVGNADFAPLDADAAVTQPMYVDMLRYVVIIYWIGFAASLILMIAGLCQVLYIIMTSKKSIENPNLRFSKKNVMPFSWGRWVVMPESVYRENGAVVLTHELAHLHCRHWLDLVLINIVKAVTWYCPVTYAIAHDMAENHEFEADNSVLQAGYNAPDYQRYLVKKSARRRFANSVVCGINNPYSLIKTRILMMQKKKSRRKVTLRALGFVPVAILLALAATSPVLAICVQKDTKADEKAVVNKVKVTEVAIMLTDEQLMQPRTEELTLPKLTGSVLQQWSRTLRYPEALAREGKQGRVLVKARVSTAGEITDVSVFKSSGFKAFDDEALRIIKGTTGLTGATYNGNKADIDCLVPVTFKSQSGPELPKIEGNSGFMLDEIVAMTY